MISAVGDTVGYAAFAIGSSGGIAVTAVLASQFVVVTTILAAFVLKEKLSRRQNLGVVVVAMGVAAIAALGATSS
jgi:drug/metabolite transporter (DMT)-like permease